MKSGRGAGLAEPTDKYEQILTKYDWHSRYPPRSYQYGIGRGAKAFVTSGELTSGLSLSTVGKPTREENDFFSALDRLEEKPSAATRSKRKHDHDGKTNGDAEGKPATAKLTMEDLAAFSGLGTASTAGRKASVVSTSLAATMTEAVPSATAPSTPAGGFLTTRNARNEAVDNAEEYLFSDERGLTMHDLLRGKNSAAQHNLMNLLEMGSPDEQGTWITHARALREMGLAKKAQQTLKEGCVRTGRKGPLIWLERLSYITGHDLAVRRRILEEATAACPSEEGLWLQLLSYQPPHERVNCLQRAVIACPRSEALWLRVVDAVPSQRDQKRIITQALQRTQDLPLLWAKLARLEPSYEVGKQIFSAAAQRYASLALIIEAAKYAEWNAYRGGLGASHVHVNSGSGAGAVPVSAKSTAAVKQEDGGSASDHRETLLAMHKAVEATVKAAAQQYLDATDGNSRLRWMQAAQGVCSYGNAGDIHDVNTGAATEDEESAAAAAAAASSLSNARLKYVWTAAYMFLQFLLPRNGSETGQAVQPTWLEDVVATLEEPYQRHGTLCALWALWILLGQKRLLPRRASANDRSEPPVPWAVIEVLRATVETAPAGALDVALHAVLEKHSFADALKQENPREVKKEPTNEEEEEEEEELARPLAKRPVAAASAGTGATQEPSALASSASTTGGDVKRGFAVLDEDCMPLPFSVVFDHTLSLTGDVQTDVSQDSDSSRLLGSSSTLTLVLAKAFYTRRQYRAALLILQLARHADHSVGGTSPHRTIQEEEEEADQIVAATAKCYSALGMDREADECLQEAIQAKVARRPTGNFTSDVLWVKLAVHRRSGRGAPCDLEAFLAEATSAQRCPRSVRLWLMRLEAMRGRIAASVGLFAAGGPGATTASAPSARPSPRQPLSPAQVKEARALCDQAVSVAHCPHAPELWAYIAVRIEAELCHAAPAARARLLDAAIACGGSTVQRSGRGTAASAVAATATVTLGLARAKVELLHAGRGPALEVVQETLQQLPKTSEGGFTVPVGELLQLSIDLEVPSARGRAAAQAVRMWRSREPLALLAVAKVYHAAGQHVKALEQALKAATEDQGSAGQNGLPRTVSNGWGDCAALLWRLAHRTEYHGAIAQRLGIKQLVLSEGGGEAAEAAKKGAPPLTEAQIRDWLLQVLVGKSADGSQAKASTSKSEKTPAEGVVVKQENIDGEEEEGGGNAARATEDDGASFASLHLHRGPLWIHVAKAQDPTNVTLLGYRASVESMLQRTADLIEL